MGELARCTGEAFPVRIEAKLLEAVSSCLGSAFSRRGEGLADRKPNSSPIPCGPEIVENWGLCKWEVRSACPTHCLLTLESNRQAAEWLCAGS